MSALTAVTVRPEVDGDVGATRRVVAGAFGGEEVPLLLDSLRCGHAWLGLSFVAVEKDGSGEVIGARAAGRPGRAAGVPPPTTDRLGFVAAGTLGFTSPSSRIPEQALQAWRRTTYDGLLTGAVVYPDVFWRHDAVGLRP